MKKLRQPGIEPGSIAWKATMLTFIFFFLFITQADDTKLPFMVYQCSLPRKQTNSNFHLRYHEVAQDKTVH